MANFGFNPEEYDDPKGNFEPLPKGTYFMKATEAEQQEAASGKGEFIKTKFVVTRGELTNRAVWERFNIIHSNDVAQRIGREKVSAWSRACGKPKATDTDQLLEVEFKAEVTVEPGQGQYGPSNAIVGFHSKDSKEGGAAATGTTAKNGAKPINDPAKQGPTADGGHETKPSSKPAAGKDKPRNPWDD